MTHYYYLIETDGELTEDSRIFRLAIGTSLQANRDYLFIIGWCESHGYYFEKDSVETSQFIRNVAESLDKTFADLQICHCYGRDYVRACKTLGYAVHNALPSSRECQMRAAIDVNYRCYRNLSTRISSQNSRIRY